MFVIKVDRPEGPMYFTKKCGPNCVAFSGRVDSMVQRYETKQDAWDEIDWLLPEAGPYRVEEVGDV